VVGGGGCCSVRGDVKKGMGPFGVVVVRDERERESWKKERLCCDAF